MFNTVTVSATVVVDGDGAVPPSLSFVSAILQDKMVDRSKQTNLFIFIGYFFFFLLIL
jgi:hypothetical protein